jgi:hypothetical protein
MIKLTLPANKQVIALYAIIALFLLSSLGSLFMRQGSRRLFFFPDSKGKFYTEVRFLAKKSGDAAVRQYAEELLLGSAGGRVFGLFTPGTRVLSCFVRGKTLYIDISETALYTSDNTVDIRGGVQILTKNILRNFGFIDTVELYINNVKAFENFEENT